MGKGRFEAFSDGVFGIAITLLVLEFVLPAPRPGVAEGGLPGALLGLWPQFLVYFASFATIGIMWMNHHALFHPVQRVTYAMNMINLVLLMFVVLVPFATEILARYGVTPTGVAFYALLMVLISLSYRGLWFTVTPHPEGRGGLLGYLTEWNPWATIGLIAYVVSIAIAYVSPIASIAIIAAVAIYYAVGAMSVGRSGSR